jgi:uncharacterized protein YndB with AHSA1/START domain
MEINRNAPASASAEIAIAASPETVWDVLANIEGWPSWNSEVKSVSLSGEVAPGTEFRWKAGPATINSTLEQVNPPRLIGWTGKTPGLKAIHVYRIQPGGEGTIVTTEESYDGWAARVFRGRMQATLEKALDSGLRDLKAEAERRTGHVAPAP